MDIKELNNLNTVSNIMLNNKAGSTNPALGSNFATMLGQLDISAELMPTNTTPLVEKTPDANSPIKVSEKPKLDNKKDVKENKRADSKKDNKEVSKTKDTRKSTTQEVDATVDAAPINTPEKVVANISNAVAAVEAPIVDASSDVVVADAAVSVDTALLGQDMSLDAGVVDVLTAPVLDAGLADTTLQSDASALAGLVEVPATLEEIAAMDTVKVMNPATGLVEEVSGQDYANMMVSQNQTQAKVLVDDGAKVLENEVFVAPQEVVETVVAPVVADVLPKTETTSKLGLKDAGKIDISDMQPVDADDVEVMAPVVSQAMPAKKEQLKNVEVVAEEDSSVEGIQSAMEEIAEIVTDVEDKHNVKISVSTNEAKNAYHSAKIDANSVAKMSEQVDKNAENPAVVQNTQTASQPASIVAPMANASAQATVVDFSETVAKQISEVSVATVSSAASSTGGEFVAHAKSQFQEKLSQTSTSDTYKGVSKEVADQIKVNITKTAVKGVDKIEIQLKPEDLGNLEVKMQISKGKLQAHIIVSKQETLSLLQKDIQTLEQAFSDAGFQMDEGSLSFSFRENSSNQQDANQELRKFIGKVFEEEASSSLQSANNNGYDYAVGENGLNIKV